MNLFDFVINNQQVLEAVYPDNGEISIPIDQFDFSHKDLVCEESSIQLVFYVDIGAFRLTTKIPPQEMASHVKSLRAISDPDLREYVVQAMEGEIMEHVLGELENVETQLAEAQEAKNECDAKMNSLKGALGSIKAHWNIT